MGAAGTSVLEVVLVLAVIACTLSVGLPALAPAADTRRTHDAARFMAGQFRLARQRAVLTGRRVCEDRDGDGVSRADIQSGRDWCEALSQPLGVRFPRVRMAYEAGVVSPDNLIDAPPVRFGAAGMAVFSPMGTASSGTLAIAGPGRAQYAVRLAGITGRTRVLRYDWEARTWRE